MKAAPLRPRRAPRSILRFAIVASQYNLEYTQPLADFAYRELTALESGCSIQMVWAPGAFEVPLLVEILAARHQPDAILALAVIIEGETAHAALIAQASTQALQQTALRHCVPVLDGIVYVNDPEQARQRCQLPEKNRGIEAARAAVSLVRTVRDLASQEK